MRLVSVSHTAKSDQGVHTSAQQSGVVDQNFDHRAVLDPPDRGYHGRASYGGGTQRPGDRAAYSGLALGQQNVPSVSDASLGKGSVTKFEDPVKCASVDWEALCDILLSVPQ
jgi:hypothetical protein